MSSAVLAADWQDAASPAASLFASSVGGVESGLYCNSCAVSLDSATSRGVHYRSEWHRYNLKRRCAGMNAIGERAFNDQLQSLQQRKHNQMQLTSVRKCELCQSSFNSLSAFQIHLKSKKHIKRETNKRERTNSDKTKQDDKETEQSEEKQQQEEPTPVASVSETTSNDASNAESPANAPDAVSSSSSSSSSSLLSASLRQVRFVDSSESETVSGGDVDDDMEFNGEPIVAGMCLFCSSDFGSDYSACLAHMLKRHGFFVPFLDRLSDAEGFLTYLGAKIGAANFCIYCLARFQDQAAVQQHMNAKNHCKIRLEDEEDEQEIMEFFEFGDDDDNANETKSADLAEKDVEQEREDELAGSRGSVSAKSGRRPMHVNGMGELVMSDGSIIGTRELKRYYKQNLRSPANGLQALPPADPQADDKSASNSNSSSLAVLDSSKHAVVATAVHPRQLHGRALENKYLRKLQRVALRVNLSSNKQKHFRKSTP